MKPSEPVCRELEITGNKAAVSISPCTATLHEWPWSPEKKNCFSDVWLSATSRIGTSVFL